MRRTINGAHVAMVIGAASFIATTVSAVALAWPNSAPGGLVDLAPVHDKRATRLTQAAAPSPADLALAVEETRLSLRQDPANPTAWLRLAYLDSQRPQGLGQSGIEAISRSYSVAPYGPDDTAWRLRFAFNHWAELDRPTRLLVLDELRIATLDRSGAIRGLADDVYNPAGRVAVTLSLAEAVRERRRNEARN